MVMAIGVVVASIAFPFLERRARVRGTCGRPGASRLLVSLIALSLVGVTGGCSLGDEQQEDDLATVEAALGSSRPLTVTFDAVYRRLVVESMLRGSDSKPIRFKLYERLGKKDAYVIFVNGRREFIEKYDVLFSSLHEFPVDPAPADETLADLPLSFATLDHAGQGLSTEGRTRGHIDDFDIYVDDLHSLATLVEWLNHSDRPVYMIGHSMGGPIAARFVQQYPDMVDGLVLTSPLFAMPLVPGVPEPVLRFLAHFYADVAGMPKLCTQAPGIALETVGAVGLCAGGLLEDTIPGCQACFNTPDGCGVPPIQGLKAAFAYLQSIADQGCPDPVPQCPEPTVTTDDAYCEYMHNHPLYGPLPTWGWTNAAFDAIDEFNAGPLVQTDTLMLFNPDDVVVNPVGFTCDNFAGECELVEYPGVGHGLLTNAERAVPIARIREFLGY